MDKVEQIIEDSLAGGDRPEFRGAIYAKLAAAYMSAVGDINAEEEKELGIAAEILKEIKEKEDELKRQDLASQLN